MQVRDILKKKSSDVITARPDHTLNAASKLLAEYNIGALVVVDETDHPVGIISERDMIRAVARDGEKALKLKVSEVMSKDLIIALMDDDLTYVTNTMTNKRIRHLPVMDDDKLAGIVSIGDAVKAQLEYFEGEAHTLRQYISGGYQ
ncbi:MAG: CBS domain-containing protein [Anaerolineae bacterium]|nr:CBS domain-containing protein [Anaerolineae bacterium]